MRRSKIAGIYSIFCTVSKQYYIGCSANVLARLNTHKSKLKNNTHSNPKLRNHFNSYGLDAFQFELLDECSEDLLAALEHYWVNILDTKKNGYNSRATHTDDDIRSGRVFSKRICKDETREKIRLSLSGRKNAQHSKFMAGNKIRERKVKILGCNLVFDSVTKASEHFKVSRPTIRKRIEKYVK